MDAVKLKEESYLAFLVYETPEVVERYQLAKWNSALVFTEVKI